MRAVDSLWRQRNDYWIVRVADDVVLLANVVIVVVIVVVVVVVVVVVDVFVDHEVHKGLACLEYREEGLLGAEPHR